MALMSCLALAAAYSVVVLNDVGTTLIRFGDHGENCAKLCVERVGLVLCLVESSSRCLLCGVELRFPCLVGGVHTTIASTCASTHAAHVHAHVARAVKPPSSSRSLAFRQFLFVACHLCAELFRLLVLILGFPWVSSMWAVQALLIVCAGSTVMLPADSGTSFVVSFSHRQNSPIHLRTQRCHQPQ